MCVWMAEHPDDIIHGRSYCQYDFRLNLVRQLVGIGLHEEPPWQSEEDTKKMMQTSTRSTLPSIQITELIVPSAGKRISSEFSHSFFALLVVTGKETRFTCASRLASSAFSFVILLLLMNTNDKKEWSNYIHCCFLMFEKECLPFLLNLVNISMSDLVIFGTVIKLMMPAFQKCGGCRTKYA